MTKCHLIVIIENPTDIIEIVKLMNNMSAFHIYQLFIITKDESIINQLLKLNCNNAFIYLEIDNCINYLIQNNYTSLAISPISDKSNLSLYETDYTNYLNLALWFGNEYKGLSSPSLNHCRYEIKVNIDKPLILAKSIDVVLNYISDCRHRYDRYLSQKLI